MLKRTLALTISIIISVLSTMVCSADGYADNNTNADNTIVDKINWLASDVYSVGDEFITNVVAGTSVSEFITKFHDYEGKVTVNPDDAAIIKTGMTVSHSVSGEQLTVVVCGDIDKNGEVSVNDILKLSSHINGSAKLKVEDAEFAAADFDSNGKVTIVDLVNIRKYIMGE